MRALIIEAAAERSPDLITADDRLEAGSGVEAVRRICARQPIPVVFIVGNPSALEAVGPNMVVLEKPFSSAALEQAVIAARDMTRPRPHLPLVS
jgi:CheY-like chemotaxis protein